MILPFIPYILCCIASPRKLCVVLILLELGQWEISFEKDNSAKSILNFKVACNCHLLVCGQSVANFWCPLFSAVTKIVNFGTGLLSVS